MVKKEILSFFAFILLFAGAAAILTSSFSMTGAAIGALVMPYYNLLTGLFLLFISSILFIIGNEGKKVVLRSRIDKHKTLVKLAEDATNNQQIQKGVNHLTKELYKGNLEAGLGTPSHVSGTDIFYLKGRNGERLYYHKIKETDLEVHYEIVGKSSKGSNQDKVMVALREYYKKP